MQDHADAGAGAGQLAGADAAVAVFVPPHALAVHADHAEGGLLAQRGVEFEFPQGVGRYVAKIGQA